MNTLIFSLSHGRKVKDLKKSILQEGRIAALMAQVPGWERTTRVKRQPIYGRQRLYCKTV